MEKLHIDHALAGLKLAIDSVPHQTVWRGAVRSRRDDTTLEGVHSVLGAWRTELLALLGDLTEGGQVLTFQPHARGEHRVVAGRLDQIVAYRLALDRLPRRRGVAAALSLRALPNPEQVFIVLDNVRIQLQARIGDCSTPASQENSRNDSPGS